MVHMFVEAKENSVFLGLGQQDPKGFRRSILPFDGTTRRKPFRKGDRGIDSRYEPSINVGLSSGKLILSSRTMWAKHTRRVHQSHLFCQSSRPRPRILRLILDSIREREVGANFPGMLTKKPSCF